MKITEDQAAEIGNECSDEFEHVETTEWEDGGKYSYCNVIFKHDGKFYSMTIYRSGSYYSEYYFTYDTECPEVEKIPVTVLQWRTK